ncbi:steroid 5-alpha-reductase DET2 isoform X2 [Morus notabilis]|uniref:steroid 5-alpha-reductase DET2 isoform X2 n=1 Tax=Morus notabilis TaxID=981085 RepID=UPI000CED5FD1|nr:steroid 5-alpha-reductase DET2 isoform X2 [Morus notabilis]
MASILTRIMLPTPPSLYVNYSSLITTAVISFIGLSEAFGSHLGYSKFFNLGSQNQNYRVKLSSRIGMLLLYTPSFLAALASLVLLLPHHKDARFLLLSLALTIHYFKRDFEVLFIHKYSGGMALGSAILISLSYFSSTAHLIYFHYKLYPTQLGKNQHDNQQPNIDMKYIGVLLFLIGISGNFYHHFLLSKLRKNGEKEKSYKIPRGGLFGLVICPHYLFEIIEFVGFCFISQTLYSFCFTIGTIFYLMGRSYATRKWYLSKFEDFPKEISFCKTY